MIFIIYIYIQCFIRFSWFLVTRNRPIADWSQLARLVNWRLNALTCSSSFYLQHDLTLSQPTGNHWSLGLSRYFNIAESGFMGMQVEQTEIYLVHPNACRKRPERKVSGIHTRSHLERLNHEITTNDTKKYGDGLWLSEMPDQRIQRQSVLQINSSNTSICSHFVAYDISMVQGGTRNLWQSDSDENCYALWYLVAIPGSSCWLCPNFKHTSTESSPLQDVNNVHSLYCYLNCNGQRCVPQFYVCPSVKIARPGE